MRMKRSVPLPLSESASLFSKIFTSCMRGHAAHKNRWFSNELEHGGMRRGSQELHLMVGTPSNVEPTSNHELASEVIRWEALKTGFQKQFSVYLGHTCSIKKSATPQWKVPCLWTRQVDSLGHSSIWTLPADALRHLLY